jgi:hypothetical protein
MPSDSKALAFISTFASVHERRWGRRHNSYHLAVTALLVTMFAAATALVPLRLYASPPALSAAHSRVRTIPAGLARAIHARLGPGPIGLGTAPLVSGIVPAGRGWSVKAPSQSVTAQINRAGRTSVSLGGAASVSLEAVSLSAGSTRVALSATSSALTRGRLIQGLGAVQSLEQVTKAGLEQQFVIAHAPIGAAKTLMLALSSSERWRAVRGGSAIQVLGSDLLYAGLHTADGTGRVLPSHFIVAKSGPQIVIDSHGATYPITIDPTWASSSAPTATLVSSAGQAGTDFGYSVAISADDTTALVGAYGSDLAGAQDGAVYVYRVASAGDWSTTSMALATITLSGLNSTMAYLRFGYSVALSADGTTALIGAPAESGGSTAYIYHVASESSWASTVTPTATIYDGSGVNDGFGDSVALSSNGTTALIGAPLGSGESYSYSGDAYVFRAASEASWASTATPTATLGNGATESDNFGYSVALSASGTTALIGSRFDVAYVFRVSSVADWASTTTPTATLSNGAVDGDFGYSVALSGDGTTAIIGAPLAYLSNAVGAAYVFQASAGNVWSSTPTPVATLTNGVDAANDFASSVALSTSGTTALIGAYGVNTSTGAAYIFDVSSESAWSSNATPSPKATLTHGGGATDDSFGASVILSPDGKTAFINTGSASIAGADYVYHSSSGSAWSSSSTPVATIADAGNSYQGDVGYSVSLSADGTTALVGYGSPYSDSARNYVNDVYIFHSSSEGTWSSMRRRSPL